VQAQASWNLAGITIDTDQCPMAWASERGVNFMRLASRRGPRAQGAGPLLVVAAPVVVRAPHCGQVDNWT